MLSMRKMVKQGVQNSRIVVLSDSRVCVGAFSKGRSSSRKLNAVIRRVGALLLRSRCTHSDLGQPHGCAFSRCELGGVACQGACCALA